MPDVTIVLIEKITRATVKLEEMRSNHLPNCPSPKEGSDKCNCGHSERYGQISKIIDTLDLDNVSIEK